MRPLQTCRKRRSFNFNGLVGATIGRPPTYRSNAFSGTVSCKAKDSEKRKEIFVCWEFQNLRKNSYHNITTEEGKLLRCNRSIQAEGAFGQLKHNRNFKRFLTGGKVKVLAELLFLGLSQNIAHLLAKCNSGLQNLHLIQPKAYLNFGFLKIWKTGSSGKQSLFRRACLSYLLFGNLGVYGERFCASGNI